MAMLQPDFVKLDMALVQGVSQDDYRARMLDALLGMARGLGVATIGEGVEATDDFARVRDHGATYVQATPSTRGCRRRAPCSCPKRRLYWPCLGEPWLRVRRSGADPITLIWVMPA